MFPTSLCVMREQVLCTAELRRRLPPGCGVVASAHHPGEVMTDVVRTLPGLLRKAYQLFCRPLLLTPAEGMLPKCLLLLLQISAILCPCLSPVLC